MGIHGINERPLNQTQQTQLIRQQTKEMQQAEVHKNDFEYVTLSDKYRPARVKHAEDGTVRVSCQLLKNAKGLPSTRFDCLHYTATSPAKLREKITAAFSNAVFSAGNPEVDPRVERQAEIKETQAARKAETEQQNFDNAVIEQHKVLSGQMSAEEIEENTRLSLQSFINETAWSSWFRQHAGFMNYPNNEGRNRATLLSYCLDKGFQIPIHGVLDEGMRLLLAHNCFYLKNTYKRSEQDEMHAVQSYKGETASQPSFKTAEVEEATQRLRRALPAGQVPSEERIEATAKALGINDQLLAAIQGRTLGTPPRLRDKTVSQLKTGIRDERNAARGGAFRPSETIKSL